MEQFCSIFAVEAKFEHIIPYVNESKSLRRVRDRNLKFAIGFEALNDGDILAP